MNGTMERTIAAAGNAVPAAFRHRRGEGPGSVGARVPCAAGAAVALLLSAVAHAQQPGESFRDCPHCPEMVMLPAGEFVMASPGSEAGRRGNERPRRRVTIPLPFAVGKYEVTNGEYAAYLQANPELEGPALRGGGNFPVTRISWRDAKTYADWLSWRTGREYRLLSESEWEYAARAGPRTAYHWGDDTDVANAHCSSRGTRDYEEGEGFLPWGRPVRVGNFAANRFGLHDMHGNVWEWVENCWSFRYDDAPSDGKARLSGDCDRRAFRGGSRSNRPAYLRPANRYGFAAGYRDVCIGFRVARMN